MNWQEVLETIQPLVSERGYQEARIFVMSRKTKAKRGLFFTHEVDTKFTLEPEYFGHGIVIRSDYLKYGLDLIVIE